MAMMKVHRHQHGFPENEEQQEIERHEHAQHGGLQQQEEAVVFLKPIGDGVPARKDGDEAQQRGEHHQQQSQPIDADVIGGAQGGNPRGLLDELKVFRAVELEDQRERNQEATKAVALANHLMARAFDEGMNSSTNRPTRGVTGRSRGCAP